MTATLELLCGPSAVGKTSSMTSDRSYKVMDYGARPPRPEEMVNLRGRKVKKETIENAIKKCGKYETKYGIFLSPEEFQKRIDNPDEFFVWYSYEDGRRYGFGQEIKDALERGENCSEQIVQYEAVKTVLEGFETIADVKKVLFLASYSQIKKQLFHRPGTKEEYEGRIKRTEDDLKQYLSHIEEFDDVVYNFPKALSHEQTIEKITEIMGDIENNRGFVLQYDFGGNWQDQFAKNWGHYLDLLIQIELVKKHLDGKELPPFNEPEFQFNLLSQDYATPERIRSHDADTNRRFLSILEEELADNMGIKDDMLKELGKLLLAPKMSIRKTYRSAYYREINPVVENSYELMKRGMPNIASLLAVSKLYYDLIGQSVDAEYTGEIKSTLLRLREEGTIKINNHIRKAVWEDVAYPFESRDRLFLEQCEMIKSDPEINGALRASGTEPTEDVLRRMAEGMLSFNSVSFRTGVSMLGMYMDIVLGPRKVDIMLRDLLLPAYLTAYQSLQMSEVEFSLLRVTTSSEMFSGENIWSKFEEGTVKYLGQFIPFWQKQQQLFPLMQELKERQETNERGFIYVDTSDLERRINQLGEGITPWIAERFQSAVEDCWSSYIVRTALLEDHFSNILYLYAGFRNLDFVRDMVEVKMPELIENMYQTAIKKNMMNMHYRFQFSANLQFLRNLKRIINSDNTEPNSSENMWMYPLYTNAQNFLQEYFITDFPDPPDVVEEIADLIDEIRKITGQ